MKKWLAVGIVLFFLGTCLIPLSAQNTQESEAKSRDNWLYVGGTGPGNYSRIQDAIDNASENNIVFVYDDASPYFEHILITTSIRLLGENKATTCIDAQQNGTVLTIQADNVTVTNFSLQHSGRETNAGIALYGSNCHIFNNTITDDFYGIRVRSTHDNVIQNNDLQNNNGNCNIYLYCTNHSIVQNNNISNPEQFTVGIASYCCSNDTIRNNTITSTFNGMSISATTHSNIEANHVTGCLFLAIELDHSPDNILSNNHLRQPTISSQGCDIMFTNSPGCAVENNTLYSGVLLKDSYPITILNNRVQDKPLVYFDGESDYAIDYPCGQIILFYCRNIIIKDQYITRTVCACSLEGSDSCTLLNNTLSNNGQGIICSSSCFTTISDNVILSNYDFGLTVDSSNKTTIDHNIIDSTQGWGLIVRGANNIITNNEIRNTGFIGFSLYGQNVSINNNIISGNNEGMDVRFLSDSNIVGNTIQQNTGNGIYITESSRNTIVDNSFTENGYGLAIGIFCTKHVIQNNEFKKNQKGVLIGDATDNDVIKNNFIGNTQDASFYNAYLNKWYGNYWGRPRLIKIIWGTENAGYGYTWNVFRVDWRPSLFPHGLFD